MSSREKVYATGLALLAPWPREEAEQHVPNSNPSGDWMVFPFNAEFKDLTKRIEVPIGDNMHAIRTNNAMDR
jgi:hypothetical protein